MTYLQKRERAAKRNNNGLLLTASFGLAASIIGHLLDGKTDWFVITALMSIALLFGLTTRNK